MAFDDLQDMLQFNIRAMLPVILIALVVVGNIAFALTTIVPGWQAYEGLTMQIDTNKAALAEREASLDAAEMIEILQQQIESAAAKLDDAAINFLTDVQANQMLNLLFGYAADSGVEITNLQAQQAAQAAPADEYDVRIFRLQVKGPVWSLLNFVAHIREAAVSSVSIRGVEIQDAPTGAVLTMETWFYVSPFASGDALLNLPSAILPESVIYTPPVEAAPPADTSSTTSTSSSSGGVVELESTAITYLAAPLPLNLLYVDTFDAGVLYAWEIDPVWTFVPQRDGQALYVKNNSAPVRFRHNTLLNAAVQARFKLDGGNARLSLRESEAGSYTAVINPSAGEIQLYRKDVLVRSAELPAAPADAWYTVQLSAIDDIVRLVVNNVEYIAIRDLAQLPPGTASFAHTGGGSLSVDDFMLWTLVETAS